MITSNPSFELSPVAAAAGGEARVGQTDLVHGAVPKPSWIALEDAARVIRETAEKLWRGSTTAVQSLIDMLLNFFSWITRPFRAIPGDGSSDGSTQSDSQDPKSAILDRNSIMSSPAAPERPAGGGNETETASGHDDDDRVPSSADEGGPSHVKLKGRFGFPASYAGAKLPVGADTVQGMVEEIAEKHPDLEKMDPKETVITMAVSLLKDHVSKVVVSEAQTRALDQQIQAQLVALAAVGDKPAEQLLVQVLASSDAGGLQGTEIRRLHAERSAQAQSATELRGKIENYLLTLKQQGLDVVDIANRAKVGDALPDWPARLDRVAPQEPAAPIPAERLEMAIEVDPDVEIAAEGPSPERIASLKASLISNNEHEQERPRG